MIPIISPMPDTDSTPGIPLKASMMYAPFLVTSSRNSSVSRSMMLTAPAQLTGFAPKVEP